MRFIFVMDPAEKMLPDKDTTFAFLRAAQKRGHTCLHCCPKDVDNRGRDLFAEARPIAVSDTAPHRTLGKPQVVELAELDAVFIRKDPPFDTAYTYLTQQLDLVKDRVLVVNDPSAVRNANEKLYAFHFAQHMPRTLVSSNPARLASFLEEVGGKGVMKPLHGAGGSGVVSVTLGDPNTRALIDLLTAEGSELALLQEFLENVREGDKRVLVLDGESLGAILRVPRPDDFRANIHVGGNVEPTTLTANEERLVAEIGSHLAEAGLWFVGLDLIGEKLIEVNVTSPTGIQELSRFSGADPEGRVIDWVEERAARVKQRTRRA